MSEQAEPGTSGTPPSRPARAQPFATDFRRFMLANLRLLVTALLFVAGIILIVAGWYGAAHTSELYAQIPYLISGGLLGLGLIILSGILATGALQERSVDALRDEIARAVADAVASSSTYRAEHPALTPAATNGHTVYVLGGGRSYHEPGCPLLEGKENAKALVPARAAAEGFAPCKLCGPD